MGRKSAPGPTDAQRRAEVRQEEEYQKLSRIENQRIAAAGRKGRGRASLISGSEQGVTDGIGFSKRRQEGLQAREDTRLAGIAETARIKRAAEARKKLTESGGFFNKALASSGAVE